jgi:hypothetical protein
MSLYDNPKTSDSTELNGRLIILEKMTKIFMTENNPTLDDIQKIINELKSNESDSSNTSVIPSTLNTYDFYKRNFNDGNNVVFQYFNRGINVYIKQEDDNPCTHYLFEINKNYNILLLGSTSHNIGYVEICGHNLLLFTKDIFDFYLDGYDGYKLQFFFTADDITFKNFSGRNPETRDKEIVIPFDIDLINLERRLKDVENAEISISDIHSNNPYVGLDPLHIVSVNQTNIPGNNDDTTFFEYYKALNTDLTTITHFGVVVIAKTLIDNGNMFWMDKGLGIIELGNFFTGSINFIGNLYLTDNDETAQVFCQNNQIKITKTEGQNIGSNIIIPYGTDLTNLESKSYTPVIPHILNTYSNSSHIFENFGNDVFQYYNTGVNVYTKQKDSDHYSVYLFMINKNDNSIQIGTIYNNLGNVSVGGKSVELYAENFFNMYLDGQNKYTINFSFTQDKIIFNNN